MRNASPGPRALRESAARRRLADHRQGHGRLGRVGGAHRIAVHGRVGERRLGPERLDVVREHTAVSSFEDNIFFLQRRLGGRQHAGQRLLDRDHCAHRRFSFARPPFARFAAAFLDQPHLFDAHAPVDRLGHVVDREAGDGDGGQRLHLDAGRPDASRLGPHGEAGQGVVGRDVDQNLAQAQRMAERNEVGGLLGRHDAGDSRRPDHVALLGVAGHDRRQGRSGHAHLSLGDRDPARRFLVRNVDHPRFAPGADMGERVRFVGGGDHRFARLSLIGRSFKQNSPWPAIAPAVCPARPSHVRTPGASRSGPGHLNCDDGA